MKRGLYESIITAALEVSLKGIPQELVVSGPIAKPELADRVALHIGRIVVKAIEALPEDTRNIGSEKLARSVIEAIATVVDREELLDDLPSQPISALSAVLDYRPDGTVERVSTPLIPLLDTTLLTNAPGEPTIGAQIASEIESADKIDIIMAFVRRSGIRPFEDALGRHISNGGEVRLLTTTYTGSTEREALELLQSLGAQVRVSYDESSTRLHAKAWMFGRESGFGTAYLGSSNLTYSAQVSGLEWNLRISSARNPDTWRKMESMFEAYWNSGDFVPYDASEFQRVAGSRSTPSTGFLSPVELRLEPFQERMLEEIAIARSNGKHRNLLVSATGTGKTVMAAVDYARLKSELASSRLLFVAHRREILEQSMATFRHALRDAAFGELWVAGRRPEEFRHVFASVQSLNNSELEKLPADMFDVVVIDEFHHAAAESYRLLLEHLRPVELLGLTATPERADGAPILPWFNGEIAAELRLWDAIDQQRLAPFEYYGVADGVDLRGLPWRRGVGYDVKALENLYTSNDAWARLVIKVLSDYVTDLNSMSALGYCVSVSHAAFMHRHFSEAGIRSALVTGQTTEAARDRALSDLRAGRTNIVFSVDVFNEGVDVPILDTLLLLRPTESPVLFTQQLGRGLRKARDKQSCLVLDFVGQHRKEFRYDRRLAVLLRGGRRELQKQVEQNFPYLPAGCHMQFDRVAKEVVLASLKNALPRFWREKAAELARYVSEGNEPDLSGFLESSGLEITDIYTGSGDNQGWSNLLEAAGLVTLPAGPLEKVLRRSVARLLHIDFERSDEMLSLLGKEVSDDAALIDRRKMKMLTAVLFRSVKQDYSLVEAWAEIARHPQILAELRALFGFLRAREDHLLFKLDNQPDVPLSVHARYTRDEIVAALGVGDEDNAKARPWREGVLWAEGEKTDVFLVTLNKSAGFSPTTRYRDFAISRELFHWESQSLTRESSPTGTRYQYHSQQGSKVVLFARLSPEDRAFWCLGPATYVSHKSEQPMEVTWRLTEPLPGDLYQQFASAVA